MSWSESRCRTPAFHVSHGHVKTATFLSPYTKGAYGERGKLCAKSETTTSPPLLLKEFGRCFLNLMTRNCRVIGALCPGLPFELPSWKSSVHACQGMLYCNPSSKPCPKLPDRHMRFFLLSSSHKIRRCCRNGGRRIAAVCQVGSRRCAVLSDWIREVLMKLCFAPCSTDFRHWPLMDGTKRGRWRTVHVGSFYGFAGDRILRQELRHLRPGGCVVRNVRAVRYCSCSVSSRLVKGR